MSLPSRTVKGIPDSTLAGRGFLLGTDSAGGGGPDFCSSVKAVDLADGSRVILATGGSEQLNSAGEKKTAMVVWRYLETGEPDTSFGGPGFVVSRNAAGGDGNDQGNSLATDRLGRVLVAGASEGPQRVGSMALWRYLADGTIDTSFGPEGRGVVVHNAGGETLGNALDLDGEGRILVAGSRLVGQSYDLVVWRYLEDGTPDLSFGGKGYILQNNGGSGGGDEGLSLTIDQKGRVLVAGYSINKREISDAVVWRFRQDGSLDQDFNGCGYAAHKTANRGGHDVGTSITLDAERRILLSGASRTGVASYMAVWRLTDDGSLDSGFNGSGYFLQTDTMGGGSLDVGTALVADEGCGICVAGFGSTAAAVNLLLWRLTEGGALDQEFGAAGSVVANTSGGERNDQAMSVAFDSAGRLVVGGGSTAKDNQSGYLAIWRYR